MHTTEHDLLSFLSFSVFISSLFLCLARWLDQWVKVKFLSSNFYFLCFTSFQRDSQPFQLFALDFALISWPMSQPLPLLWNVTSCYFYKTTKNSFASRFKSFLLLLITRSMTFFFLHLKCCEKRWIEKPTGIKKQ